MAYHADVMEFSPPRGDHVTASTQRARMAVEQIAAGGMVVVVDRDAPDNMGMLVMAAAHAQTDSLRAFAMSWG